MRITVLNGTPKGEASSVTMQYVRYILKRCPQNELKVLGISHRIMHVERDE